MLSNFFGRAARKPMETLIKRKIKEVVKDEGKHWLIDELAKLGVDKFKEGIDMMNKSAEERGIDFDKSEEKELRPPPW